MKLLALETSTEACSAALLIAGEIRERYTLAPQQHGRLILEQVGELLADAGLMLAQLDAIAFGRGPGSFTGVRIACSVTQGLAFSVDLPVIPVSTLAALAEAAPGERALSAIDARMGEVYWCAFARGDAGLMSPVGEEGVYPPLLVPLPSAGQWTGIGSGWKTYHEALNKHLEDYITSCYKDEFPRAYHVVRQAEEAFKANRVIAPEQAVPVYLRDRIAEKKASRSK